MLKLYPLCICPGTEEESSDRHSSEEEGEAGDDMWAISDAQARHYAAQFAQLRPERGMLSGQTARYHLLYKAIVTIYSVWTNLNYVYFPQVIFRKIALTGA